MWRFKRDIFRDDDGTTPITGITSYSFAFSSPGRSSSSLACAEISFPLTLWAASSSISMSMQMYLDSGLTIPVGSGNLWYQYGIDGIAYRIDNSGQIAEAVDCLSPTFTNTFCCAWVCDDTIHVPPGGSVTYIDEFGATQTVSGLCVGNSATITYRSIVSRYGPTNIC